MSRTTRGSQGGFTLIEILVAVAVLAILSAALTPAVIKYVNDARQARALSDSQVMGQALLAFQLDTGRWPVSDDGDPNDAGELSRLVGLAEADIATGVPAGKGPSKGWQSLGNAGALEDHLIRNKTSSQDPLYPTSATAPQPPGWDGPYLSTVPLDPWARSYVCNVRYLEAGGVKGVTPAEQDNHSVFCLSAGPNGIWDTPLRDKTDLIVPGGDDIGWPVQTGMAP
jgi:prepilin-type N-terminal cleavage/methylation domain-containing protein